MFSSFKERLNTGLSNLHEKGVSTSATAANSPTPPSSIKATIPGTPDTTHAAGAEGIHDDKAGSLTSLASPHSPTPSSTPLAQGPPPTASSFVSLASRISGGVASTASSSSLFFRRPVQHQQAATQSSPSSLIVSGNAGLGSGVGGNIVGLGSSVSGGKLAELVQRLTLDPKDETPDKADLAAIREQYQSAGSTVHKQEQQLQQDKQGQEETQEEREHEEQQGQVQHQGLNENGLPEDVIEKLEILQRYEARFSDLAGAFKKIVQEKIAAEAVLKATTALEDLGDIEALQAHMQNMARKSEMSMQEIKRLSDELRETRAAKDTEAVSQAALIQDLRNQLSLRLEEIDRLKHRQKDLSASSDTLSLSDTLSVHHLDHSSDVDTKPNSIDLISTPSSPQPPSLSASALDPSLDSVTVNLPTVATSTASLTTPSPTSTVAKPKRATKDKDQALRELMARLESVLKEKNQAREDQEETVEQMEYWKRELGKEREANKAMAEKMDRLQAQIAEIEEQRKKEATAAGASPSTRRTIQEGVSEDASTDSTTTATTATTKTVDGVEDDSVEDRLSLLQNELCTVRLELAAALEREIALRKAHEELATLQQAYSALQTSKTKTERALDAAMGQIQELEDLAIALGETKQALVEAQEEVQERQQLLDLERQWREEAEKSRDTMKKEYDGAVRQARIEAEKGLQEKVRTLEQQVAEADTQRKTLEHAMIERSGAVEEIVVLKEKILQLGKELEDTATKQQAAFHALREEKEKVVAALITQQQQEQLRQSRIQELESELKELSTNKIPSFAQDSEADNKTDKEPSQETGNLAADKVPSKNALKKLRQELNHVRKARQEAETTVAALQSELETMKSQIHLAYSTSHRRSLESSASDAQVARDNHISSIEELQSLKQEREELSEKLTRLERLHQGFERSSSEKIRAFEQELAVLVEQKVALEAQVQEQSDLLIKEKEKEKELEQARVAEGIERVTLELAAVRTAERFASDKVTELAKDRDMVIEKVAKLEKRLEKLRECKVGQEQSLTGQIEELNKEKTALEGQLVEIKTAFESWKAKSEEEKEQLQEKHTALVGEHEQAMARISELEEKLKGAPGKIDDGSKIQDLEAQLATLKTELQTKINNLEVAQGQAQVQRTLHADKVMELTNQIQTLKAECDSYAQPKHELELQLQEAADQAESLREQLKILEEDNARLMNAKTESQEQMSELQSKISALGLKEKDLKEALDLAKDTIHQRDEDLSAIHKQLKETETDLAKTVQKLSKLENERKSLSEDVESIRANLTKTQQESKAAVAKSSNQQSATAQELQRLKATHVKILQERDQVTQERDKLSQEKEAQQKEMQMKQAELETLQKMHESTESQMREYQTQLTDARNRVDTLEELTSIAKRVAETKVEEFEALKARGEQLDEELTYTKESLRRREEAYGEMVRKLKTDIEGTREVLGEEISGLIEQVEHKKEEVEELRANEERNRNEIEEMSRALEENSQTIEKLETEIQEFKSRKRDLELELQHFKDLEEILAKEKVAHAAAVEEFKMREGHLRTVNKTLKEEVRKFQKHISPLPSPSTPYSPYSQSNVSQAPGGSAANYHSTPSTPKPKSSASTSPGAASTMNGGRSFSSPNMTPPATPRFVRHQPPPDEDVNIEYLKNVLLNFVEHKERRQQLIPVVAQMLRLSADEQKRFTKVT